MLECESNRYNVIGIPVSFSKISARCFHIVWQCCCHNITVQVVNSQLQLIMQPLGGNVVQRHNKAYWFRIIQSSSLSPYDVKTQWALTSEQSLMRRAGQDGFLLSLFPSSLFKLGCQSSGWLWGGVDWTIQPCICSRRSVTLTYVINFWP